MYKRQVKACFGELLEKREDAIETAKEALEYGFDFMEEAFGESQEMVSFVTEDVYKRQISSHFFRYSLYTSCCFRQVDVYKRQIYNMHIKTI